MHGQKHFKISEGNRTLILIVAALGFIVLLVVLFVAILQLRKRAKKKKQESNEALERLNQPVFSANVNGYEDGPNHGLAPSPTANMTHNQLYSVSLINVSFEHRDLLLAGKVWGVCLEWSS